MLKLFRLVTLIAASVCSFAAIAFTASELQDEKCIFDGVLLRCTGGPLPPPESPQPGTVASELPSDPSPVDVPPCTFDGYLVKCGQPPPPTDSGSTGVAGSGNDSSPATPGAEGCQFDGYLVRCGGGGSSPTDPESPTPPEKCVVDYFRDRCESTPSTTNQPVAEPLPAAPPVSVPTLGGDEGTACEVLLCLSSPLRPSECVRALQRYFSINFSNPLKTIRARLNFLNLCPVVNESAEMAALAEALANGAGMCEASQLNSNGQGGMNFAEPAFSARTGLPLEGFIPVSNAFPPGCAAYHSNPYTQGQTKPVYVGVPEKGGFWTTQEDYPAAAAAYNRNRQIYDEAQIRFEKDRNDGGG